MKKHVLLILALVAAFALTPLIVIMCLEDPAKEPGFIQIFHGNDLGDWDGDPNFWRAENGVLVGETTDTQKLEHSTYILWKKRKTQDFELKVDFRLSGGNSGIQYRSVEGEGGRWTDVKGYQADLDAEDKWTGILYECGLRRFLALRGQKVAIEKDGASKIVGSVGDPEGLKKKIHRKDWNEYHIIAMGDHLVHLINGQVMVDVQDAMPARIKAGYLGFQLHQGPPMKIELKNIHLKELSQTPNGE